MKKSLLLIAFLILQSVSLTAQTPYLLKDIIGGVAGGFAESSQYVYYEHPFSVVWEKNGYIYFTAVGYNTVPNGGGYTNDVELWRSDGTTAGTELVKDIYPGNEGSYPSEFVDINGTLYFTAYNGSSGKELWKTDGTNAGTVMVKDINPGNVGGFQTTAQFGYNSLPFSVVWQNGNNFYFIANNYTSPPGNQIDDVELWMSDGTDAGTVMLKDIYPGHESSYPEGFHDINGTLYFAAYNNTSGKELWKTDGSTAGTVMVKDIIPGSVGGFQQSAQFGYTGFPFSVVWQTGNDFYFVANGYVSTPGNYIDDIELWKSDGTAGGTFMVKDINPGHESSSPQDFIDLNGTLYFAAYNLSSGKELWKTDGSTAGTVMVKDIIPGNVGGFQASAQFGYTGFPFSVVWQTGNDFYFIANGFVSTPGNYIDDIELWKSNGTDAGTFMVKDIYPGHESSFPRDFKEINGALFFTAYNANSGRELWKSDGSTNGTVIVKEIISGGVGGFNTSEQFGYGIHPFGVVWQTGNTFYFTACGYVAAPGNYISDVELWKSDGTDAGTMLVKDIYPGNEGSHPIDFTDINGTLYFTAYNDVLGRELWRSDGTTGGTVMVKELISGNAGGFSTAAQFGYETWNFSVPFNISGDFYFTANDYASTPGSGSYDNNIELWKSDGTNGGTNKVMDIFPSTTQGSYPFRFTNRLGKIFFTALNDVNGRELWVIDVPVSDGPELISSNKLEIFPNPAKNILNVKYFTTNPSESAEQISIVDLTGREIYSYNNSDFSLSLNKTIDISSLSPGIYGVIMKTSKSSEVRKFVKQ